MSANYLAMQREREKDAFSIMPRVTEEIRYPDYFFEAMRAEYERVVPTGNQLEIERMQSRFLVILKYLSRIPKDPEIRLETAQELAGFSKAHFRFSPIFQQVVAELLRDADDWIYDHSDDVPEQPETELAPWLYLDELAKESLAFRQADGTYWVPNLTKLAERMKPGQLTKQLAVMYLRQMDGKPFTKGTIGKMVTKSNE